MSNDETSWAELAALEALGVLPEPESDDVRAHLRSCETCMAEYQHHREASDLLGYLSENGELAPAPSRPERLKARVLRAAQAAREPKSATPRTQDPYAHLLGSNAFVDFQPGVKWAVMRGDGVTLVHWVFEPPACGDIPDEIHSSITQSGVVIEGSFSMHYGDGTIQRLRQNDVYMITPGTVHGAEIHERTILFDVYTPNNTELEDLYLEQRRMQDESET